MKKAVLLILVILSLIASGCSQSGNQSNAANQTNQSNAANQTAQTIPGNQTTTQTIPGNQTTTQTIPGNQVTREITTPDGQKVTVTGTDLKGGWCQEGQKWNMDAGTSITDMTFKGIMTEGKYAGYCHIVSVINAGGKTFNVDLYINEDGSGYQVIDIGGLKYESEIKK